jgi:hypothetical protein
MKVLIGYMKTIVKLPDLLKSKIINKFSEYNTENEKGLAAVSILEKRIGVIKLFLKQYYLKKLTVVLNRNKGKNYT